MKNKIIKNLLSIMVVCCLAMSMGAAVTSAEKAENDGIAVLSSEAWDMTPYTMYLKSGEITYQNPDSSTMRVTISTYANSFVDSLYHDVVIYKNGTKVYDDRTTKYNSGTLISHQDFSAVEGDFFSTYVTHYVSNKGYTEHCDTHHDQYF